MPLTLLLAGVLGSDEGAAASGLQIIDAPVEPGSQKVQIDPCGHPPTHVAA